MIGFSSLKSRDIISEHNDKSDIKSKGDPKESKDWLVLAVGPMPVIAAGFISLAARTKSVNEHATTSKLMNFKIGFNMFNNF